MRVLGVQLLRPDTVQQFLKTALAAAGRGLSTSQTVRAHKEQGQRKPRKEEDEAKETAGAGEGLCAVRARRG